MLREVEEPELPVAPPEDPVFPGPPNTEPTDDPITDPYFGWQNEIVAGYRESLQKSNIKVETALKTMNAEAPRSSFYLDFIRKFKNRHQKALNVAEKVTLEKLLTNPKIIWRLHQSVNSIVSLGHELVQAAEAVRTSVDHHEITDMLSGLIRQAIVFEQTLVQVGTPSQIVEQLETHFYNTKLQYGKFINRKADKWNLLKTKHYQFRDALSKLTLEMTPSNEEAFKVYKRFRQKYVEYEKFLRKERRRGLSDVSSKFTQDINSMIGLHHSVEWVLSVVPFTASITKSNLGANNKGQKLPIGSYQSKIGLSIISSDSDDQLTIVVNNPSAFRVLDTFEWDSETGRYQNAIPDQPDLHWYRITDLALALDLSTSDVESTEYLVECGVNDTSELKGILKKESDAVVIEGYYPLYHMEADASAASLDSGSSHTHNLGGITYYMPSGGEPNIDFFHGTFFRERCRILSGHTVVINQDEFVLPNHESLTRLGLIVSDESVSPPRLIASGSLYMPKAEYVPQSQYTEPEPYPKPPEGKYSLSFRNEFTGCADTDYVSCVADLEKILNDAADTFKDLDKIFDGRDPIVDQAGEQFLNGFNIELPAGDWYNPGGAYHWIGSYNNDGTYVYAPDYSNHFAPLDVVDHRGRTRRVWYNHSPADEDTTKLYAVYPGMYTNSEGEETYSNVYFRLDLVGQDHHIYPVGVDNLGYAVTYTRPFPPNESDVVLLNQMKSDPDSIAVEFVPYDPASAATDAWMSSDAEWRTVEEGMEMFYDRDYVWQGEVPEFLLNHRIFVGPIHSGNNTRLQVSTTGNVYVLVSKGIDLTNVEQIRSSMPFSMISYDSLSTTSFPDSAGLYILGIHVGHHGSVVITTPTSIEMSIAVVNDGSDPRLLVVPQDELVNVEFTTSGNTLEHSDEADQSLQDRESSMQVALNYFVGSMGPGKQVLMHLQNSDPPTYKELLFDDISGLTECSGLLLNSDADESTFTVADSSGPIGIDGFPVVGPVP